ncbi:hypothetical protein Forpi1262_v017167 [Fusarium oxysporum f. sp. raphani]|uniref:Uncharacterized protein n=1 Tax=Fusarium oxysporum f. sp. raphani TaxID=96318 RepID=A0A8J5P6J2_FUSOX|nr:hypothetical protein Forpi1262_v017167 [Fusarium oxysporum f. sp. raphani]
MQTLLPLPQVCLTVAGSIGLIELSKSEGIQDVLKYAVPFRPAELPIEELERIQREAPAVTIIDPQPAANEPSGRNSSDNSTTQKVINGAAAGLAGYWAFLKNTVGQAVPKVNSKLKSKPVIVIAAIAGITIVESFLVLTYLPLSQFSRSPNNPQGSSQQASAFPSSQSTPGTGGPGGPGGPDEPPSDDEGSADESPPELDREIRIPKKMMEDIINKNGQSIWQKFQQKLTREKIGEVWRDPRGDFRIDAGSVVSESPQYKTWNLQVNRHPPSPAVKNLLKKLPHGTHEKLFWGLWNVKNPPQYDEWVKGIMDAFL